MEIDTNNDIIIKRNKKHNLSYINNKSSNCITPGSFNPLINYKFEENKYKKKYPLRNSKNQDHFFNMNPTQTYEYKPQLKRVFNCLTFSRNQKKSGKKLFCLKNVESKEDGNNFKAFRKRNTYLANITKKFCGKNINVYEYEEPIISYKEMNKMN